MIDPWFRHPQQLGGLAWLCNKLSNRRRKRRKQIEVWVTGFSDYFTTYFLSRRSLLTTPRLLNSLLRLTVTLTMSLNNDWLAFVVTLVTAGLVVEAIKYTARKQWLSSAVSRKFMHIGTHHTQQDLAVTGTSHLLLRSHWACVCAAMATVLLSASCSLLCSSSARLYHGQLCCSWHWPAAR